MGLSPYSWANQVTSPYTSEAEKAQSLSAVEVRTSKSPPLTVPVLLVVFETDVYKRQREGSPSGFPPFFLCEDEPHDRHASTKGQIMGKKNGSGAGAYVALAVSALFVAGCALAFWFVATRCV